MSEFGMGGSGRIDRFVERLDAHGPDLDRWPAAEAGEARAVLESSVEARVLHADATHLSDLVAEAAEADIPNGFVFRVVGEVAARRADRLGWLFGSPGRAGLVTAGFCVAALALGVALGAVSDRAQALDGDLDLGAPFALSLADSEF